MLLPGRRPRLQLLGHQDPGRVASIGLAAELVGVIAVGLYLLIFQRKQDFRVFFDSMGAEGNGTYITRVPRRGARRPVPVLRLRGLR